ncbi:hypothetical protein GCM10020295_43710 [Streptomyces cinereospinus]
MRQARSTTSSGYSCQSTGDQSGPDSAGPPVEEAGGQEGGGLVHQAGLLQQVAGGTLAEPGGEALGQAVAPGQFGEGRDDARVQPGRPAAHPPGGQRHPGQQAVPAGVRQPDLFLRDDPQPVIHSLCTLGRRGGDPALHLRRVRPAAAQQEPGQPAGARVHRAEPGSAARRRGDGDGRVQAPHEAPGGGYVGVRRGPRTGDDRGEDRAQLADAHPPQERGADDEDGAGRRTAMTRASSGARRRIGVVRRGAGGRGPDGCGPPASCRSPG